MVLKKAIGILAITAVGGPTRWLDVHNLVRLRTKNTKERFRVHRSRSDFDIIRLLNHAPVVTPIMLKLKDEILKGRPFQFFERHHWGFAPNLMFSFKF